MSEKFSVLMSVYKNDNPFYFYKAVQSIINQTKQPSEIIIVVDGPVSKEIIKVINIVSKEYQNTKIIWLDENVGLGNALKIGLRNTSYELVARMDSDDISCNYRFELQLDAFKKNPALTIVGGQIREFLDDENNFIGIRKVPLENGNIKKYMKNRCPFNHMTVMFKKSHILEAGGYIELKYNEDYYLWIRLLINDCQFENINRILVNVRVDEKMYQRRGGYQYFQSEKILQDIMLEYNIIKKFDYIVNVFFRFVVQVLLPNKLRAILYKAFFRKKTLYREKVKYKNEYIQSKSDNK